MMMSVCQTAGGDDDMPGGMLGGASEQARGSRTEARSSRQCRREGLREGRRNRKRCWGEQEEGRERESWTGRRKGEELREKESRERKRKRRRSRRT